MNTKKKQKRFIYIKSNQQILQNQKMRFVYLLPILTKSYGFIVRYKMKKKIQQSLYT